MTMPRLTLRLERRRHENCNLLDGDIQFTGLSPAIRMGLYLTSQGMVLQVSQGGDPLGQPDPCTMNCTSDHGSAQLAIKGRTGGEPGGAQYSIPRSLVPTAVDS